MFSSSRLNICACWNGLIRPLGESMKTRTPRLPRSACSAALPVSPEVAPRTLSVRPRRASSCSNALPRNCIAMSLNASVGPFESPSTKTPGSSGRSGVIRPSPKTSAR
jgi:hypothetical protein